MLRNRRNILCDAGLNGVLTVHDSFTDTDGVTLPNHTPDINLTGNPWVKIPYLGLYSSATVYDLAINANTARWSNNNVYNGNTIDINTQNCMITVFDIGVYNFDYQNRQDYLVLRYDSSGNGIYVYYERQYGYLYITYNGKTLAKSQQYLATQSNRTLSAMSIGNNITATVTVSGVVVASASTVMNAPMDGTRFGLHYYKSNNYYLDDFYIYT